MRIHRIYCKSVSKPDKRFFLDDSESNHLIKALRLKENSQVEVFDGNGNFQIGIPDFYLFREIEQNIEFTKLNGLNVTIVTTAKTDREARLLLSGFQAPFAE